MTRNNITSKIITVDEIIISRIVSLLLLCLYACIFQYFLQFHNIFFAQISLFYKCTHHRSNTPIIEPPQKTFRLRHDHFFSLNDGIKKLCLSLHLISNYPFFRHPAKHGRAGTFTPFCLFFICDTISIRLQVPFSHNTCMIYHSLLVIILTLPLGLLCKPNIARLVYVVNHFIKKTPEKCFHFPGALFNFYRFTISFFK